MYVDVPERYVSQLTLGDRADIFVDALGGDPIAGLVAVILAEGYASSHTFPVVVGALNPEGRMRSNMSARVRFQIAQPQTSILVHKDALVSGPQGQVVYLARDGLAVSRPVETGAGAPGLRSRYRRTRAWRSSGSARQRAIDGRPSRAHHPPAAIVSPCA